MQYMAAQFFGFVEEWQNAKIVDFGFSAKGKLDFFLTIFYSVDKFRPNGTMI